MPYYRFLQNVSLGLDERIVRGSIQRLKLGQEKIRRLVQVGAISPISTPPLNIVPGWEDRAKKLAKRKITTIEELLEALDDNPEPIAKLFELTEADVLQWRQELIRDWLTIKE